jgi:hypothetical protein
VLVTARTAEAIAAVREKLPTDLASLVIASVASDREGAKLLEEAIQKLSDDVISLNVDRTKEEIARLEEGIVRIDRDMQECDRKLSDIAAANLAPLTWHGEECTAMELAGILVEMESEHGWMTDRPLLVPPTTLDATLERLREALPKIGGDVVYISAELPDLTELPTAAELIEAHKKELEYRNRPVEDLSGQPIMARDNAAAEEVATSLQSVIDTARIALEEAPSWEQTLVAATIRARLADEPTPKTFENIVKDGHPSGVLVASEYATSLDATSGLQSFAISQGLVNGLSDRFRFTRDLKQFLQFGELIRIKSQSFFHYTLRINRHDWPTPCRVHTDG